MPTRYLPGNPWFVLYRDSVTTEPGTGRVIPGDSIGVAVVTGNDKEGVVAFTRQEALSAYLQSRGDAELVPYLPATPQEFLDFLSELVMGGHQNLAINPEPPFRLTPISAVIKAVRRAMGGPQ